MEWFVGIMISILAIFIFCVTYHFGKTDGILKARREQRALEKEREDEKDLERKIANIARAEAWQAIRQSEEIKAMGYTECPVTTTQSNGKKKK